MFIFTVKSSLLDQLLHETDTDAVRREEKRDSLRVFYYYISLYRRYSFDLKLNK